MKKLISETGAGEEVTKTQEGELWELITEGKNFQPMVEAIKLPDESEGQVVLCSMCGSPLWILTKMGRILCGGCHYKPKTITMKGMDSFGGRIG